MCVFRYDGAYPELNVMESTVQKVVDEVNKQKEEYIVNQLISLNIDPDVLMKQTLEIERLNKELDKYKWIPCEERLPEDEGYYLVTDGWGDVEVDWFHIQDVDSKFFTHSEVVVAWMMFPEPYT